MNGERHAVVLVYSTSYALKAESVLADAGIDCKLIPVPRRLSSDCGVCVQVCRADRWAACRVLADAGVELAGIRDV